jgi:hypothetical protein
MSTTISRNLGDRWGMSGAQSRALSVKPWISTTAGPERSPVSM